MNQITKNNEKFMTIKEIADILGVTAEAIKKQVRNLFPDKMKKGKTTYLNEKEITLLKSKMRPTTKVVAAKTDLQMSLQLTEAALYFENKYKEAQKENEIMKPKAESYDTFINSKGLHSIKEVANIFGIGQNNLFKILRENKYFFKRNNNNFPYQQYVDNKYFELKEKVIKTGYSVPVIKATKKGVILIEKLLKRISHEANN